MSCKNCSKLCDRIRITTAVNIVGTTVVYNLPSGGYNDCETYCIILAQNVPNTAQIGASVAFSIGGTAIQYPLVSCDCRPVSPCGIRGRRRYKVRVETTATGAVFKMLSNPCCSPSNRLASVNGTAPVTTPASVSTSSEVVTPKT